MRQHRGFTLIELVTVITLTGVIALLVARNISEPVRGFVDLSLRAELVDTTELALRRMSREIRLALPNSVRLTDGTTQNLQTCTASAGSTCAVEILRTLEGGRYRDRADGSDNDLCTLSGDDHLDFAVPGDCFEVLGPLTELPDAAPGATRTECLQGVVDCLVVFNTGQTGADAYNGDNIAGIQAVSANALTFDISPSTSFPLKSPRQRFQVVDMPVSYVCNPGAGTITRQADYTIAASQSVSPGGTVSLLANRVSSCTFAYFQGSSSRNALLTAAIELSAPDSAGNANTIRLVEQIQVPNVP